MKALSILLNFLMLGCTPLQSYEKEVVGVWTWDIRDSTKRYEHYGEISLNPSGTMSRSSEFRLNGLNMAEDSFGRHSYGWFIESDKLCFAADKRSWKRRYTSDPEVQCKWKIHRGSTGNPIVVMWDGVLESHVELSREK